MYISFFVSFQWIDCIVFMPIIVSFKRKKKREHMIFQIMKSIFQPNSALFSIKRTEIDITILVNHYSVFQSISILWWHYISLHLNIFEKIIIICGKVKLRNTHCSEQQLSCKKWQKPIPMLIHLNIIYHLCFNTNL